MPEGVKAYIEEKDRNSYVCRECAMPFKTKANIRYHIEKCHYSPGYPCPYCGKVYRVRNGYTIHMSKSKSCSLKRFYWFKYKYFPERSEGYNRFFVCYLLDTDAAIKSYYVHAANGLYSCKACGFTAKAKCNLRYHVEMKHYSPGYSCPKCLRVYKARSTLMHHFKQSKTCIWIVLFRPRNSH